MVLSRDNSDLGLEIREDAGERFDIAKLFDDLLVVDGALLRVFSVLAMQSGLRGGALFKIEAYSSGSSLKGLENSAPCREAPYY